MAGLVDLAQERGGVLVTVALMLPVLIGVSGFALDIGHWFGHKRHLQVQADASALAAASQFRYPCDNAAIINTATDYSGTKYNAQIADTPPDQVHRQFNSATWYNQPQTDPTVDTAPPCTSKMVDVKLTETDLPWFLKATQVVPFINAHARVSIFQKATSTGLLPISAIDVNPKAARAYFVDETTSPPTVIASTPLAPSGTSGGLATWSNPMDSSGVPRPVSVNIPSRDIGVRIALSGSTSTTCGDPLVACYDASSANGVVHIRGYDPASAATASAPQLRGAALYGDSCEDGYFTATAASYPCTVGMRAAIDFGGPPVSGTLVAATLPGSKAQYPLVLSNGEWSGGGIPIAQAMGPVKISLGWGTGCTTAKLSSCTATGTFDSAQRAYSASDAGSGPLKSVSVSENGVPDANSFPRCAAPATCPRDLVVTIGITGSLQNAQAITDPIVPLKIVSGNGSQTQALDCDDKLSKLRDELAGGCAPKYTDNQGTPCPAGATALWSTAQPWQCVAINTGQAPNQVAAGLNLRILGSNKPATCTDPNQWSKFGTNAWPPAGDPRIVQVFLTPFGSFSGSGGNTVPVTRFATFYITGWTGQGSGFDNPCQGNGDDPVPNGDAGTIVGHFIAYVDNVNNGGAGSELCDFNTLGSCVAVLTR